LIARSRLEAVVTGFRSGAKLVHAEQLTGGVSADVFRLDFIESDGTPDSVVLRAHGESHSGHPAQLEFDLLAALFASGLPIAQPLAVDVSKKRLDNDYLVSAFIDGTSTIEPSCAAARIEVAARVLAQIHKTGAQGLPNLPERFEPLPEVFDYWPEGAEWQPLKAHLQSTSVPGFSGPPSLCHGDFWPENILWREGAIVGVLDWEDAAWGDPLSDLACSRLEFRYRFDVEGMQTLTRAYQAERNVDVERLAVWQIYVAAAAQCFMSEWGLPVRQERHMRKTALLAIREAGEFLMNGTPFL